LKEEVKVKTEKKKVSDLKFYPGNPRTMSKSVLEKLKKSILEFGIVEPLVINPENEVIGGNQRLKALQELGIEEVDCVVVDLPKQKEKALNLALNKITGEFDFELLKGFLDGLDGEVIELTGFEKTEIDKLFDVDLDFDVSDAGNKAQSEKNTKVQCPKCGFSWSLK
jgi:hypothetical protein